MSSKSRRKQRLENKQYYALDNKLNLNLSEFSPLTKNQEVAFKTFGKKHLFLHGLAGTGKTFIGVYLALKEIFNPTTYYKKLIIVRSLVQTRDMGHLPGSDKDKMKIYETPYIPICAEIFNRGDAYTILKQKGFIDFISTSFIRGTTLNNAIVLVDECQNMTKHELDSIITRIGENCKIIFAGDLKQTDLQKHKELSGLRDFMRIIKEMNCFEFIEFKEEDIVRSKFVKDYIITKNRLEDSEVIRGCFV